MDWRVKYAEKLRAAQYAVKLVESGSVVYVGMFVFKKLYLTAGLYAVFFVLAALGYAEWKRSYAADRAAEAGAVPQAA